MGYRGSKNWLSAIGSVFFSLGILSQAQSQEQPNSACPTGYAILGEICWNETNGDVVNPRRGSVRAGGVISEGALDGNSGGESAGFLAKAGVGTGSV